MRCRSDVSEGTSRYGTWSGSTGRTRQHAVSFTPNISPNSSANIVPRFPRELRGQLRSIQPASGELAVSDFKVRRNLRFAKSGDEFRTTRMEAATRRRV